MGKAVDNSAPAVSFQIFRRGEAVDAGETGGTRPEGLTPIQMEGMQRLYEGGLSKGIMVKSLFDQPGFGLNYVWAKSGFPLPLHTHDVDCLYYIIAGEAHVGTEILRQGDGFFVPAHVPYVYKTGPDGVEALEIRHTQDINTVYIANTKRYWDNLFDRLVANRDKWDEEVPPQQAAEMASELVKA